MRFLIVFTGLLLGLASAVPTAIHAQSFINNEPISLTISPRYPAPYEEVRATPGSNLFDLAGTVLTFYVDGKEVAKQSGGEPIRFTMKGPGEPTTVRVTAATQGRNYEKALTLRPASVALVTEPISTAHPFYQGANLVASEGRVRMIAVADLRTSPTNRVSSNDLIYTWKIGTQILLEQSGIGRSVITITAPIRYRNADVSVTVTTKDSSVAGEAKTNVSPTDPVMRLYVQDPLTGPLFDTALGNTLTMTESESTLRAVPYFFPSAPTLAWTVNGSAGGTSPIITLRQTGSGKGSAKVSAVATGPSFFSTASISTLVNFGATNNSGFFGL
ncbi:MAG: hypothetical protein WAV21_03500 [Minisyncoccia bacterium]